MATGWHRGGDGGYARQSPAPETDSSPIIRPVGGLFRTALSEHMSVEMVLMLGAQVY